MGESSEPRPLICIVCLQRYPEAEVAYRLRRAQCVCEGCNNSDAPEPSDIEEEPFQRRYSDVWSKD
jgi:hypothetical protein